MTERKKGVRRHSTLAKWPYVYMAPFFLAYFMFFVFPTIYSLVISFTDWDSLVGEKGRKFVGLANYVRIFTKDKLFFKSIGNTFLFMIVYIPILIIGSLVLATMLYQLKWGRRLFQTVNILPYITTPVAIGVIFSTMFDTTTGIVNKVLEVLEIISQDINWLGDPTLARVVVILIIVWKNMGYYLLIYFAGLATIPDDIIEAAKVDGANTWQVFWKITVPFLRPITVFLILTSIISGFQLYDEPYLLYSSQNSTVGGPGRACMTSMIYFYDQTFKSSTKLGYGAAISYAIFIVILIVSFLVSKIINKKDED